MYKKKIFFKKKMNGKEEEKVDRHNAIISAPLKIFSSKPFNRSFIERRIDEIYATPKDYPTR